MLTIGRTLMGNPELILMDEPAEGLAPLVVRSLEQQVLRLRQEGETILFSEMNVRFSTRVAERAYVIDKGKIQYTGTIKDLSADNEVKKRYLMI